MKYLKIYENKNDELWIVTQISTISPDDFSLTIFDDEESAENYFIDLINENVKKELHNDDEDNIDYVFTVEDAEKMKENLAYRIEYGKYINEGKYELPENLKIGRNAKKYNI